MANEPGSVAELLEEWTQEATEDLPTNGSFQIPLNLGLHPSACLRRTVFV